MLRDNDCCAKTPEYSNGVVGRGYDDRPEQPMMDGSDYRSRAREINIQPMNYGFLVRVGCQSFVFETAEKMIKNLDAYLADPEGVEKAWLSNTLVL